MHASRSDASRDSLLHPGEEPPVAAHLVTPRTLYSHHGIYVGNGRVIHYAGFAYGPWRGSVEDISLECFSHGRMIKLRKDPPRFSRHEVVERVRSRLGENNYRILTNNCEHFCVWAICGESRSTQVERLRAPHLVIWHALCATFAMRRRNQVSLQSQGALEGS